MKAIVLGATGAVGLDLVEMLLKDDEFSEVEVFVRRVMPMENAKLTTHIVNFKQPNEWQDMIKGDVVFSCMGTSLKVQAQKKDNTKLIILINLSLRKRLIQTVLLLIFSCLRLWLVRNQNSFIPE